MPLPLILQIQEAAMDSKASVTDALRKAKIACFKLDLKTFLGWVDCELGGYTADSEQEIPNYRCIIGELQAFNPVRGWMPIHCNDSEEHDILARAFIVQSIGSIEDMLIGADPANIFTYRHNQDASNIIRRMIGYNFDIRVKLAFPHAVGILHAVRNILLDWTLSMEREGIVGENLIFSSEDRRKSSVVTEKTVNNFNIGHVGALVQNAQGSIVQGSAASSLDINDVRKLVEDMERLLPAAALNKDTEAQVSDALDGLKDASKGMHPDKSRIRKGLELLKGVMASAGETILKTAVEATVDKLLAK